MAFTISVIQKTVWGDNKVHTLSCTVDSASGNIDTGLSNVYGLTHACASMATAGIRLQRNLGSNSTAIPGYVNVNSAAAGDVFILTVYGK
jgi:hypothetical protein